MGWWTLNKRWIMIIFRRRQRCWQEINVSVVVESVRFIEVFTSTSSCFVSRLICLIFPATRRLGLGLSAKAFHLGTWPITITEKPMNMAHMRIIWGPFSSIFICKGIMRNMVVFFKKKYLFLKKKKEEEEYFIILLH